MSPQEIAKSIADELREHPERWIQNEAKQFGCRCLAQHIEDRGGDEQTERVFAIVGGLHRRGQMTLIIWNDRRGRTVADVIALCDKVAQS